MTDPVNLILPANARFRGLAQDVGGRYVVAAGGSEADASAVGEAIQAAVETLAAGAADDAGMELSFRAPAAGIEVTVRCEGKSSVVTHPLPAAKT